jgi:hypothetical protein
MIKESSEPILITCQTEWKLICIESEALQIVKDNQELHVVYQAEGHGKFLR